MLGRNIGHVIGQLDQLFPPVVGLLDNTLTGFGDMVLEADHFLKTQLLAELGGDLHRLVIDRIAPVETDQWRSSIIAREQFGADQSPQPGIRIVVAHETR